MLVGVVGESKKVNRALLLYACRQGDFLVIDCATAADPHALFPKVTAEQLERVHVMPLDLIYQFRDAAAQLPELIARCGARRVIITSPHRLFTYHDEEENAAIELHTWELLAQHRFPILIAVPRRTRHEALARRYCHQVRSLDTSRS